MTGRRVPSADFESDGAHAAADPAQADEMPTPGVERGARREVRGGSEGRVIALGALGLAAC